MAECLEEWLLNTLGIVVTLKGPEIGKLLYDGKVFDEILRKYNAIDHNSPVPTTGLSEDGALKNLETLRTWFKNRGVPCSSGLMTSVARKDPIACTRVLFELFSKLEVMKYDDFLDENILQMKDTLEKKPSTDMFLHQRNFKLENPLRNNVEIVRDYKNLKKKLADQCREDMKRRREIVSKWNLKPMDGNINFQECKTKRVDAMAVYENHMKTINAYNKGDTEITNAKYVSHLRKRQKDLENLQTEAENMQENFIRELWGDIQQEKEQEFNKELEKLLIKPCEYEEKFRETLEKLHENNLNFRKFTSFMGDLAEKRFSNAEVTYQQEKKHRKSQDKAREAERVLELHKRLAETVLGIKGDERIKYCRRTANDLVTLVEVILEFTETFDEEPTADLVGEWKELFFNHLPISFNQGQPIQMEEERLGSALGDGVAEDDSTYESIRNSMNMSLQFDVNIPNEKLIDPFNSAEISWGKILSSNEQIAMVDSEVTSREIIGCLTRYDMNSYLNFQGPWDSSQFRSFFRKKPPDMNKLMSYIVQRLLQNKYPLPEGPSSAELPPFEVRKILGSFKIPQWKQLKACLRDLLSKGGVELIDVHTPVNFCLARYKEEVSAPKIIKDLDVWAKPGDDDGSSGSQKVVGRFQRATKYPMIPKAIEAEMKKKKSTPEPDISRNVSKISQRISSTSRRRGTMKISTSGNYRPPNFPSSLDKSTQAPSISGLKPDGELTRPGVLGKMAFMAFAEGKTLSDVLMGYMLVEYLKTLIDKKGFVLCDFPVTASQANIFEHLLNGKPMKYWRPKQSDVDLFGMPGKGSDRYSHLKSFHNFEDTYKRLEKDPEVQPVTDHKDTEDLSVEAKPPEEKKKTKRTKLRKSESSFGSTSMKEPNRSVGTHRSKSTSHMTDSSQASSISFIQPDFDPTLDDIIKFRKSEILPVEDANDVEYGEESYFDAYIQPVRFGYERPTNGDTAKAFSIDDDDVVSFYASLGLHNQFHYRYLDADTAKRLARVILEDYTDERKTSFELFFPEALEKLDDTLAMSLSGTSSPPSRTSDLGEKPQKHQGIHDMWTPKFKTYHTDVSDILKSRTPRESAAQSQTDATTMPTEIIMPDPSSKQALKLGESKSVFKSIFTSMDEHAQSPSAYKLQTVSSANFVNFPLNKDVAFLATSAWECTEYTYLENMEILFHLLRQQKMSLHQYVVYIKKAFKDFMSRGSELQGYITNFQLMINKVDDDFRNQENIKNELYLRADELIKILKATATSRKERNAKKKFELTCERWIVCFVYTMSNLYLGMMQEEIDLFTQSLQVVEDYYAAMAGVLPHVDKCVKIKIPRNRMSRGGHGPRVSRSKSSSTDPMKFRERVQSMLPQMLPERIKAYLRGVSETKRESKIRGESSKNPTYKLVSRFEALKPSIEELYNFYKDQVINQVIKKPDEYVKSPTRSSKTPPSDYTLDDEANNDIKNEWLAAITFLHDDTLFRLKLIEMKAQRDLDSVMDRMRRVFIEFNEQVDEVYHQETTTIDDCSYVFLTAIELGSKIQKLMVVKDNKFFFDDSILLYPDPPLPPPNAIEEPTDPFIFTIHQLHDLVDRFKHMAPNGIIESALVSVLRELALEGCDYGNPLFPSRWTELEPSDFQDIVVDAFADQTTLDWKNFVINLMGIPHPSIGDLIRVKAEYEKRDKTKKYLITLKEYEEIPLWIDGEFGETIEDDLKLALAKTLIFKLFQTEDNELNYFDMMMYFCKQPDAADGLEMALQMFKSFGFIKEDDVCTGTEHVVSDVQTDAIIALFVNEYFDKFFKSLSFYNLEYLPKLSNNALYASEIDEYEQSENILRSYEGNLDAFSERSLRRSESKDVRSFMDHKINVKFLTDDWQMCITYDAALRLICTGLRDYALSSSHHHAILDIQRRLKALCEEQGNGHAVKVYSFFKSDLIHDLQIKTKIFQMVDITEIVKSLVQSKWETWNTRGSTTSGQKRRSIHKSF